jgi:hypothetical protein
VFVLPPVLGRNAGGHCHSGRKYKHCCFQQDETLRRQLCPRAVPAWLLNSSGKLHQFEKYACKSFGLASLLASQTDSRRAPQIPTFEVVNSLFHSAVLRIPSRNAREGDLKESDFQKLLGYQPTAEVKPFSVDVVANVLDKVEVSGLRKALEQVVDKAERNKVFREGSYGGLRCVAIDGWERFASYHRHCPHCLGAVRESETPWRRGGGNRAVLSPLRCRSAVRSSGRCGLGHRTRTQ